LSMKAFGINLVNILGAGRPRRKPSVFCNHLDPANRCMVARCICKNGVNLFASQIHGAYLLGGKFRQNFFFLQSGWRVHAFGNGFAKHAFKFAVYFTGIATHACGEFRRQQSGEKPILIRCPNGAVKAKKRSPCTFLSTETEGAIAQAIDEPLEADRRLVQLSTQLRDYPIDHPATYYGLAYCRFAAPFRTMLKEVVNSDRKIMIRW